MSCEVASIVVHPQCLSFSIVQDSRSHVGSDPDVAIFELLYPAAQGQVPCGRCLYVSNLYLTRLDRRRCVKKPLRLASSGSLIALNATRDFSN